MDKEKAIKIISGLKDCLMDDENDIFDYNDAFDLAIAALNSNYSHIEWTSVKDSPPPKKGWYLCSLKDGRVNSLYYHSTKGWVDNIRLYMFELYDIYSKMTGQKIEPESEALYWNDWVVAWKEMPEAY